MTVKESDARAAQIEKELMAQYGAAISGRDLRTILGYRSGDAFRHAVSRGKLVVPTFFIEGRRGRCAATKDVARWTASLERTHQPTSKIPEKERP